jgi:hypothetical protein
MIPRQKQPNGFPPLPDQFAAITNYFIPKFRPDLARAKITGHEDLPEMAKLIANQVHQYEPRSVVRAGRVRFEYELRGRPVEEELSLGYIELPNPQFHLDTWEVSHLVSVRAPKGSLDQAKITQKVIQNSICPGIAFCVKLDQFCTQMNHLRVEEIRETGRRSKLFAEMANKASDEKAAQYWAAQKANAQLSDARAEYNRSVTPYDTGDGKKVELPNGYTHAWIGENGNIIQTNDGLYNPNTDLDLGPHTGWKEMDIYKPH